MLKYQVIESKEQYEEYCKILHELVFESAEYNEEEIKLLTLLIEDWDDKNSDRYEMDPVELIKSLMEDHGMKQYELAEIAGVVKSVISEVLNYKRKMSKGVIRNISDYFKINQEALNKPYKLAPNNSNSGSSINKKVSRTVAVSMARSFQQGSFCIKGLKSKGVVPANRKSITLAEAEEVEVELVDIDLHYPTKENVSIKYGKVAR